MIEREQFCILECCCLGPMRRKFSFDSEKVRCSSNMKPLSRVGANESAVSYLG